MSNTITNLFPDIYEGLDVVSRELAGFIPSATLDSGVERAAKDQTIRAHVAPASTAADITPGQQAPNTGDQTIGNNTMTISKARAVPVRWNGNEQKKLDSGVGYANVRADQFAQAFRTLVNEVEADAAAEYIRASRAYGTAGTTPFASDLSDTAQVLKILKDNGAPTSDLQMVIDTTAGAKMRTLTQLTKANEAADASLLRQGVLLDVHGMQIRESGQISDHTKGGGSSYTTDTAGYAIGDTVITLITGTGTILAGDVVTWAGDSNKYVVAVGNTAAGPITLAAPGLKVAIATSATAMTIGDSYTPNMGFSRSAFVIATRLPERPMEGDRAEDVEIFTDPRSGLSFEIALYKEYRQVHYEVSLAWGQKLIKPEHSAILLG